MAAPVLTITNTSDVAKGGATTAIGKVAPASSSAATTERLWNDLAAAGSIDTAKDVQLVIQAMIQGGSEWLTSGVDLLDRHGVEMKITARNSVATSEAWQRVGTGIQIFLPDLPAGEYHEYSFRVTPPVGVSQVVTEIIVSVAFLRFTAVTNRDFAERGLVRGVGGGRVSAILSRSVAIGVTGTATFQWPDYVWYHEGLPLVELDHDETISEVDGLAASLVTTESYIFLAVLDATGETIVKGNATVGPTYPADAPAVPAGTRLLGWGERFDDGDAFPMTFTSLDELPDFCSVTTSSLNATIARATGPALVDGNRIDSTSSVVVLMTASSTNAIRLLQDGSGAVTLDGSLTQPGAEILADIVTDGSGETSRVERRRWAGRTETITFAFNGSPTGTTTLIWVNPFGRPVWIRPDMVQLMLDAVPAATGNAKADLFTRVDAGARTTIFTSFGTDDRRPVVAFGDASAINKGLPEVVKIDVGEALECDLIVTAPGPGWAVVTIVGDVG